MNDNQMDALFGMQTIPEFKIELYWEPLTKADKRKIRIQAVKNITIEVFVAIGLFAGYFLTAYSFIGLLLWTWGVKL